MKDLLKKILSAFLVLAIIFSSNSIIVFADEFSRTVTTDDPIEFSKDFLSNYHLSDKNIVYEEFLEKYLDPNNTDFNDEMKLRFYYRNTVNDNDYCDGSELISSRTNFLSQFDVDEEDSYYIVGVELEKYYTYKNLDGSMTDINMLSAKIFIKLEKTETGLKLFDIYDGISYFFDKPSSPYPSVSKQSLENTSLNTKVEVKRSHEEILKRAKMYIDGRLGKIYLEDSFFKDTEAHENYNEGLLEDVKESSSANYNNDLVKMLALRASSTYDLNRTKAREYARKWATTPPYCDSKRYQYIPKVAPGNYDCTNFASQVLHEAGVPFSTTDTSNKNNEWTL